MARNRRGKVFSFFSDKYNISFFHKPSYIGDDVNFIFILDGKVQLSIRVYENIILVINSVQPLTSVYLSKFYQSLIDNLVNQDMFTVMVSKHTNTNVLWQLCNEYPVVEDKRFIQIPLVLYTRLAEYYSDVNKYGLYLLAVTDELSNVNVTVEQKKEVKVIDTPPVTTIDKVTVVNELHDELLAKIQSVISKKSNSYITEYQNGNTITLSGITFKLVRVYDSIHITDTTNQDISTISCMNAFETLEDCLPICDIYVDCVKTKAVYNICNIREYEKSDNNYKGFMDNVNSFGSYKIKKFSK